MSSSIFTVKEHTLDAAHIREYARATSDSQDTTLRLHVKQYFPKDNPKPQKGDVTIVGAHANGFPKELYEPLWDDFYHEARKRNIRIRSIIIADAAWQGQSGLLNHASLGDDPSWNDYARDIQHMLNTLRPPPPLLAIGHSFGTAALVNVALVNPRLFTSLVLLDPVISRFASAPGSLSLGPAAMSIYRRDHWPSREDAAKAFARGKFYQAWDPRVLDLWVRYGVRDGPDGGVVLTTTKHQEVFTYLRPSWPAYDASGTEVIQPDLAPDLDPSLSGKWPTFPVYRAEPPNTLIRLPNVRPSVLYVFGGKSNLSPPDLRKEKMDITGVGVGGSGGAKRGRVKHIVGEEYGHLIPMEAPRLCAESAADWIKAEVDRWWVIEREYEVWTKKSLAEKTTISDEYKNYMGRPDKSGGKEKAKI